MEQGHEEEGITQLQEGLAACQTGIKNLLPYFLALQAEAYGKVGRVEKELTVLTEALAQVDQTGERWCEAERYRLKDELLLAQEIKSRKSKDKRKKASTPCASRSAPL